MDTHADDVHSILTGNQEEGSVEPTPVIGTIRITNLGPEATVEKLGELFGSLGKIKVPLCYSYCQIKLRFFQIDKRSNEPKITLDTSKV